MTHALPCLRQVGLIKEKYWEYEYDEVMTPNMYNFDLWKISGHADHYKENMFSINVEKQEFGLKPMNCPGHCLMFNSRVRSYRDLPLRMADFGVLHRNEFSGALHGLTRWPPAPSCFANSLPACLLLPPHDINS